MVFLLALYTAAGTLLGESRYSVINSVGPLILTTILGCGAWAMLRTDPRNVWTALFWFRLSTALYFGIGTSLIFVVDSAARERMEAFYGFLGYDVFKLNLVVTVSVVLVLVSSKLGLRAGAKLPLPRRHISTEDSPREGRRLLVAALACLIIGATVNYGVVVPSVAGWVDTGLPVVVQNLSRLTLVGIFLIMLWSLQYARSWLPLISGLVAIEILTELLIFAKSTAVMTLVVFLLAFLWRKSTLSRLAICGSLVLAAYFAIQPVIRDARIEIGRRYGANTQAGLNERFHILLGALDSHRQAGEGIQSGLSRLSYVKSATFVIQRYDSGQPGDWAELLPAVFVPRVLWPEKPVITRIGVDIYELGTGRTSSAMGAGVFADAYWAMGWLGVIVFMPAYGVILGALTAFAARVIRERRWLYFLVVLMALRMGFRLDGHYISDVAGSSVILLATYAVTYGLDVLLTSRSLPRFQRPFGRVKPILG